MQKTVYLDSNDFSDLSKPEASLDESDKRVLDALRSARANGRAVFYISPIHLSEAVHASETYKESAVRRAALMSELAGDNLLRFPTDVCKLELDRVITGQDDPVCSLSQIVSGPGEWFGASPPDNLDDRRNEIRDIVERALQPLSRQERRRQLSRLNPTKRSSHPFIRSIIKDGLQKTPSTGVPIPVLNPELVLEWYLGNVSDEVFRSNSMKLARDPLILFKHLIDELGHRETLYDFLRDQGVKWSKLIESGMTEMAPIFAFADKNNLTIDLNSIMSRITNSSFWQKVIGALSEKDLTTMAIDDIVRMKDASPSTAIFIHALIESVRVRLHSTRSRAVAGNLVPAAAKLSDYGDFMHSIYAPYFDIFRCDSSFAAILKGHAPVRSRIVGKRRELLSLLV